MNAKEELHDGFPVNRFVNFQDVQEGEESEAHVDDRKINSLLKRDVDSGSIKWIWVQKSFLKQPS